MVVAARAGLSEEFASRIAPGAAGSTTWAPILSANAPRTIEDVEADPALGSIRPDARSEAFRAALITPLIARCGDHLGTIAIFFREPHRPPPRQARMVEIYARQAADFVEAARLRREARDAGRRKEDFLAALGHELRNPLAAILYTAGQLRPTGGEAPDLEAVRESIAGQARHMARLVDDLLDISRISRGEIALRKEETDLEILAARAFEAVRSRIASMRHTLEIDLPPGPLALVVDPTRIVQVLVNLLVNAAKFTEPGGRIVLAAGRDGHDILIRVRDNGIGIAPELLPKIFDLYTHSGPGPDHVAEGLGIGLALVKHLVALHGGTVLASSAGPGRGSEFLVRLPSAPPHDGRSRANEAPIERKPATQSRDILIVDDQADAARSLARFLAAWGHEVRVAHDGPSALEEARARRPDLLLLDIGLPGLDGHEVARRFRAEWGGAIRIVALTGFGREAFRRPSQVTEFDHAILKPILPEDLRSWLEREFFPMIP